MTGWILISIHLMFLLITMLAALEEHMDAHFNTSHVSINQSPSCGICRTAAAFQYISCFY